MTRAIGAAVRMTLHDDDQRAEISAEDVKAKWRAKEKPNLLKLQTTLMQVTLEERAVQRTSSDREQEQVPRSMVASTGNP